MAMVMARAGFGATKFVILVGAGLMGSMLIKNNKLKDFVGDLNKVLSKHFKDDGQQREVVGTDSAIHLEVQRLTQELSKLVSSSRTVTVVQTGSTSGTPITSFLLPAAVVGTVGYGYMRWRGFSFEDFMYVTRKGMRTAVSGVGKQLDHVSAALSSTRKHMNQRLDTVDSKLDDTVVITNVIRDQVEEVKDSVGRSLYELENVNMKMQGLGLKIDEVQESQHFANQGIFLLIEWVHRLNLVAPAQDPELAEGFNSWYLKATRLERFSTVRASLGLKEFSQDVDFAPRSCSLTSSGAQTRSMSASVVSRRWTGLSNLTGINGVL